MGAARRPLGRGGTARAGGHRPCHGLLLLRRGARGGARPAGPPPGRISHRRRVLLGGPPRGVGAPGRALFRISLMAAPRGVTFRSMDKFVIEGGYPLSGAVRPAGNKNAALPILAASLLTEEELVISNVPRIRDVDSMLALLEDLGVAVTWRDEHEVVLRASSVTSTDVDAELAGRIRASFLLAGPLVARTGEARLPPPGGDFIGRRRLDPHLDALRALGAQIHLDRVYEMWAPQGLS